MVSHFLLNILAAQISRSHKTKHRTRKITVIKSSLGQNGNYVIDKVKIKHTHTHKNTPLTIRSFKVSLLLSNFVDLLVVTGLRKNYRMDFYQTWMENRCQPRKGPIYFSIIQINGEIQDFFSLSFFFKTFSVISLFANRFYCPSQAANE